MEGGLRHAQGVQRARLSMPLHPVQLPWSPQLHQPSAGSSPGSSESLLDHLSGCIKACELHPCSNQCLKDRPSVNLFRAQIHPRSEQCGAASNPCPSRLQRVLMLTRAGGLAPALHPPPWFPPPVAPRKPQGFSPPLGALGEFLGRSAVNWQPMETTRYF